MTAHDETPSSDKQPNFEEALERLDAIVQQLEEGQIGLAEGLTRYEEGIKLLRQCYQILERAERRIELLSRVDANGHAATESFDDGALSLEEKAQAPRSRRRTRNSEPTKSPTSPDEIDESGRLF